MLIEDVVKVSQDMTKVSFIGNGVFCNIYNESAYVVSELLGLKLKLRVMTVKKLHNQKVVVAGLPRQTILKHFKHAQQTEFGFELRGNFNAQGYDAWLAMMVAKSASKAEHATSINVQKNSNTQDRKRRALLNNDDYCLHIPVTRQQLDYLLGWQEGAPIEFTENFMADIRYQTIHNILEVNK